MAAPQAVEHAAPEEKPDFKPRAATVAAGMIDADFMAAAMEDQALPLQPQPQALQAVHALQRPRQVRWRLVNRRL